MDVTFAIPYKTKVITNLHIVNVGDVAFAVPSIDYHSEFRSIEHVPSQCCFSSEYLLSLNIGVQNFHPVISYMKIFVVRVKCYNVFVNLVVHNYFAFQSSPVGMPGV